MALEVSAAKGSPYSFLPRETQEKLREAQRNTESLLKKLDQGLETPAQRQARLAAQKKQTEKTRQKKKKMNKLDGDISYYRSRLMMNPNDSAARGALAMAKCQRYWAGVEE